jgi:hypothetical protein
LNDRLPIFPQSSEPFGDAGTHGTWANAVNSKTLLAVATAQIVHGALTGGEYDY